MSCCHNAAQKYQLVCLDDYLWSCFHVRVVTHFSMFAGNDIIVTNLKGILRQVQIFVCSIAFVGIVQNSVNQISKSRMEKQNIF